MASKNQVRKGKILSQLSFLLQRQKMNALSLDIAEQNTLLTAKDRVNIKWPYGRK